MVLKTLVTGKNRKVASDICEHLEQDRGYLTVKCDSIKSKLLDMVLAELPKVVIICLGDETKETVEAYNVLKSAVNQSSCTIIVIASDEDEKFFMKYSELPRVLFLSRPVSLFALYEKMTQIEEDLEKNKENNLSLFREYSNGDVGFTRKQILVVDDDSEQLIHIKEQLEEFYDVSLVKSGDAAFKFLSKKKPNLILLDYMMPDKDGPFVIRKLRTIDEYADIPVIFLTGVTERDVVIKTLTQLRPQGYIVKPSKKSELVAKIIDVLG
ncbi:response regulator [Pseudobutyrivibrio sp.]